MVSFSLRQRILLILHKDTGSVSFHLSQFVGGFRVLFTLEADLIVVYAIKDRKEAYE